MRLSHGKLITISGLVWFVIGVYLLQLGLNLIFNNFHVVSGDVEQRLPLIHFFSAYVGGKDTAAILLVVFALYLGYFKGRYVLGKSANRSMARIAAMPNPAPLKHIYGAKYYVLLGSMVALGISIKYLGLSHDVRGIVDIMIGSALVNGAMVYFKAARKVGLTIDKQTEL